MNGICTCLNNIVNVTDFGAVGDGITDDTSAVSLAVQQVNINGGCLYFPKGVYKLVQVTSNQKFINIESEKDIVIDFDGSEIILQDNSFAQYNIIYVNNAGHTTIKNGYLTGDRLGHDYTTVSSTHEFGYGIFVSKKDVVIDNMHISQMTGDAIVTKNGVSGGLININNCELSYCRRQGISVLDSDVVRLSNVKIHHIGTWDDISGASPMSGIDIEAASGTLNVNKVELNNVEITSITKVSLICSGRCDELSVVECTMDSGVNISCPAMIKNSNIDKKYVSDIPFFFGTETQVINSTIRLLVESVFWMYGNCDNCVIECSQDISNGVYLIGHLIKCVIKNFGNDGNSIYISFKESLNNSFENIIGCLFENCAITGVGAEYFCPADNIFKNCVIRVSGSGSVKNCAFYGCNLIGNICQIDCYNSFFDTVPFKNTYNHFYHCTLDIPSATQEQFCVQSGVNYNLAVDTVFKINGECHAWAFKHLYVANGMRFIKSVIELTDYEKGSIDLLINQDYADVVIIYKDGVI